MRNNTEDIVQRITTIESLLRELRIDLEEDATRTESKQTKGTSLKIGERVLIKNPTRLQPAEGILTKIHHRTRRGTVTAVNEKGKEILIVRLLRNLQKKEEYE